MPPVVLDWTTIKPKRDFRYAASQMKNTRHAGSSLSLKVVDQRTGREEQFIHQGPLMSLPFGISKNENPDHASAMKASLSFDGVTYDKSSKKWIGPEKMVKYLEFIQSVDSFNTEHVYSNVGTVFPKQKGASKEVIDAFYFKNVWIGDKCLDGDYPPTLSTKLCMRGGNVVTKFFDRDGSEVPFDESAGSDQFKNFQCIPLIRTTGMWFANTMYGMSLQIVQLMLFDNNRNFVGCAIDLSSVENVPPPRCLSNCDDDDEHADGKETGAGDGEQPQESKDGIVPSFNMINSES